MDKLSRKSRLLSNGLTYVSLNETVASVSGSYTIPADGFYILSLASTNDNYSAEFRINDDTSFFVSGKKSNAIGIFPFAKGTILKTRTGGSSSNYTNIVVGYYAI